MYQIVYVNTYAKMHRYITFEKHLYCFGALQLSQNINPKETKY